MTQAGLLTRKANIAAEAEEAARQTLIVKFTRTATAIMIETLIQQQQNPGLRPLTPNMQALRPENLAQITAILVTAGSGLHHEEIVSIGNASLALARQEIELDTPALAN